MSPGRSEAARRMAAIEALVCRDVGRKTAELIEASAGGLAAAAEALAGARSVGLITGFFVPRGDVAAPETDGPVGTALLAAALAACGVPARIAVATPCAGAGLAARCAATTTGGGPGRGRPPPGPAARAPRPHSRAYGSRIAGVPGS